MTDFNRALHELQTAPGVTQEEAAQIAQDFLAASVTVPGYSHPDITIGFDPDATSVHVLDAEHGDTDNGLKTTCVTFLEMPREEEGP